MKRYFTFTIAAVVAAGISATAWSQGGQSGGTSGGASTSGGAGTSSAAGTSGTAGTPGTAGAPGAAGAAGTAASPNVQGTAGTARTSGTVGRTQAGANLQGQVPGQARAGASARSNANLNVPQPWFANPAVRQQLNLNDQQFGQLNNLWMDTWAPPSRNAPHLNAARQQQGAAGQGVAGQRTADRRATTPGAVTQRGTADDAQPQQQVQQVPPGFDRSDGSVGLSRAAAEQQQAQGLHGRSIDDFNAQFNAGIDRTLTDPQTRQRFNELNRQFLGMNAFNDPQVRRQLNLTPEQQRQVGRLAADWRRQLIDVRRSAGTQPLTPQQWSALRGQFDTQLNRVLTPAQSQAWNQLIGQRFDFPMEVFLGTNNTGTARVPVQQGPPVGRQPPPAAPHTRATQRGTAPDRR